MVAIGDLIEEHLPSYEEQLRQLEAGNALPWELARIRLMAAADKLLPIYNKDYNRGELPESTRETLNLALNVSINLRNITVDMRGADPSAVSPLVKRYHEMLSDKKDPLSGTKKREVEEITADMSKLQYDAVKVLVSIEEEKLKGFAAVAAGVSDIKDKTRSDVSAALTLVHKASQLLNQFTQQKKTR